jgi:hypothetical protein
MEFAIERIPCDENGLTLKKYTTKNIISEIKSIINEIKTDLSSLSQQLDLFAENEKKIVTNQLAIRKGIHRLSQRIGQSDENRRRKYYNQYSSTKNAPLKWIFNRLGELPQMENKSEMQICSMSDEQLDYILSHYRIPKSLNDKTKSVLIHLGRDIRA